MSKVDFINLVVADLTLFVGIVVLVLGVYVAIFWRDFKNLIDPFFFYFVLIYSFSFSDVLFLFLKGEIEGYYFYYFVLSQVFLIYAFFLFRKRSFYPLNSEREILIEGSKLSPDVLLLFFFCSISYVVFQLITYYVSGIPLFMLSRWETYSGGSGFGVISRLIDVVSFVSIYLLIHLVLYGKIKGFKKFFLLLLFAVYIVFGVLSGSKIGVIQFFFLGYFVFQFGHRLGLNDQSLVHKLTKRTQKLFFVAVATAFVLSFVGFYVKMTVSGLSLDEMLLVQNPLLGLVNRFVFNGDIYIMAFPNEQIEKVIPHNTYLAVFDNIFAALRLLSWNEIPPNIGFQLEGIINPFNERLEGPTAHYSIFGLVNYGFIGGLVFSSFTGALLGFFYNKFFYLTPKNVLGGLLYSMFAYSSLIFTINPAIGMERFFNIAVILFPLILSVRIIKNVCKLK